MSVEKPIAGHERQYYEALGEGRLSDAARAAMHASYEAGVQKDWAVAAEWAEKGLALRVPDPVLKGYLLFYLGSSSVRRDPTRGTKALAQMLRITPRPAKLQSLVGEALYCRATAFQVLDRPSDQLLMLTRAERAFRRLGQWSRLAICRCDIAWVHLLAGNVTAALPWAAKAEEALATLAENDSARIYLSIVKALQWRLQGHRPLSSERCRHLLAAQELEPWQEADLRWILAMNLEDQGRVSEAVKQVIAAEKAANRHWWPPQMNRISQLKARLGARRPE